MSYRVYETKVFDLVICGDPNKQVAGQNVLDYIERHGIWAELETQYLIHCLNKEDPDNFTFVDVGSNSGYFTLIALKMGFKVIAIEPCTDHKQYVMQSIKLNDLDISKLTYIEKFVSDVEEPVLFDGWSGNKDLMNKNENNTLVDTIGLDSLINDKVFLKVDVEGAEPDVFKSAVKAFDNNLIKYLMFELTYITPPRAEINQEQVAILDYLDHQDYHLYDIVGINYRKIDNTKQKAQDWLYEFVEYHKRRNPELTSAGTNIVAQKSELNYSSYESL